MTSLTTTLVLERLAAAEALDRLWGETMGLPDGDSKGRPLRLLAELLARERVPYALIGGVAMQLHTAEPRTTLDIDLGVTSYDDIPRQALLAAGFEHTGRHASDNWRAPGTGALRQRVAVQFSDHGEGLASAVTHASTVTLDDGVELRVARVDDLIVLKLAAALAPERRPSKRAHDLADVLALLEEHSELASAGVVARVQDVRDQLLSGRLDVDVSGGTAEEK